MVNIKIEILEATNLPNSGGLFDKCEPYVKLKIGSEEYQTRVLKNYSSKEARFDESFTFCSYGSGELEVTLMDAGRFLGGILPKCGSQGGGDVKLAKGSLFLRKEYEGMSKYELKMEKSSRKCSGDPVLMLELTYTDAD